MENETQGLEEVQTEQKSILHQVTPLSKYLALALFVILPFFGGYVGYTFAPEKVVEVEKKVIREVEVEEIAEVPVEMSDEIASSASEFDTVIYNDAISGLAFRHPGDWNCDTKNYIVEGKESPYIQCRSGESVVFDMSQSDFPDGDYFDFVAQPDLTKVTDNYTRTIRFRDEVGLGITAAIHYNFNFGDQNYSAFIPYKNQNGWKHDYYASQEVAINTIDSVVTSIFE